MATYNCASRTNYFNVKDEAAFRAWASASRFQIVERGGLFGLLPGGNTGAGSFEVWSGHSEDRLDFCDEIAKHLTDDSVAVVMEAGHEEHRYVGGWAVAINSKGGRVQITLEDVYEQAAAKFGISPTRAVN